MTPRVVVLRALGLGDFLTGVPALRGLRRALPGHRLFLAAPDVLRPLVELSGAVDELLPTGELEPVPWVGRPPEVAVDLHGNGPESKAILERLSPGRLVAFSGPGGDGRHVPGPRWNADEHEVRRWCRLVTEAFGVQTDPQELALPPPDRDAPVPGPVLVHPGAAAPSRRWPAERYAAVARHLHGAGARVLLTGSPAETSLVERVREGAGLPAEAVAGPTDLGALAALVASARLVVCGDTGMAHLASAYRTPSVVLFGPTPPHRWGPPPDGPHTVIWRGTGLGDPHAAQTDPALLQISVADVVGAVEGRLAGARTPGRTSPSTVSST